MIIPNTPKLVDNHHHPHPSFPHPPMAHTPTPALGKQNPGNLFTDVTKIDSSKILGLKHLKVCLTWLPCKTSQGSPSPTLTEVHVLEMPSVSKSLGVCFTHAKKTSINNKFEPPEGERVSQISQLPMWVTDWGSSSSGI